MSAHHIRWMIRRDMAEAVRIDQDSFEEPWTDERLINHLREPECIGLVVEEDDRVVGYVVYLLKRNRLMVIRMAVAPSHRRRGIGRAILNKLAGKLNAVGRSKITIEIPETDLGSQLFMRSCGFRAVQILGDKYKFRFDAVAETSSVSR